MPEWKKKKKQPCKLLGESSPPQLTVLMGHPGEIQKCKEQTLCIFFFFLRSTLYTCLKTTGARINGDKNKEHPSKLSVCYNVTFSLQVKMRRETIWTAKEAYFYSPTNNNDSLQKTKDFSESYPSIRSSPESSCSKSTLTFDLHQFILVRDGRLVSEAWKQQITHH